MLYDGGLCDGNTVQWGISIGDNVEECCAIKKTVEECCVMEILCCVEQWKYFCSVLYNGVLYDGNTVR